LPPYIFLEGFFIYAIGSIVIVEINTYISICGEPY
jgi:hypothetical protein